MLIAKLLVNENLLKAEYNFNQANSDNIIELCRGYLVLLNAYRDELYKLRGTPEINLQQSTSLARELTEQVRKVIRTAVEITTRERNKVESLLESFISISGYEAIDTFNQLQYKGLDNWELGSNSIRSQNNGNNEQMSIEEAVDTASLLRREAYITDKTTFLR